MSDSKKEKRLTELPYRLTGKIIKISDGRTVWEHLNEIGIRLGDRIEVIRKAPFKGPLLVRCNGQDIALGQNIAAKICVEIDARA
jgi:ferrous iron transport protein A